MFGVWIGQITQGGILYTSKPSQESSICKTSEVLIGFSMVSGGQVIAHPFAKVSQDPKMPDLDIGLTRTYA